MAISDCYVNIDLIPSAVKDVVLKEASTADTLANIFNEKSKFYCSGMQHAKPGEELKFNEPPKLHWEPKALGKVKSMEEIANGFKCDISLNYKLYSTADSEKWLKDLQDYLWKEAERRRRMCNYDDAVDAFRYYCINGFDQDTTDESTESKAFQKLNDILRKAFRTVQEREIAKYSVKSREELSVPYDIWE